MESELGSEITLGIPSIDKQHMEIIALIESINDSFNEGNEDKESIALDQTLATMESYAQIHFKYEEEIFAEIDFEGAEAHIQEHKKFIAKVSEFRDRQGSNSSEVVSEVLEFILHWLMEHIQQTDQEYVSEMNRYGIQ